MVRKHLGFSIDEWSRLPWWQQRLYIEELEDDFERQRDDADDGRIAEDDNPTDDSAHFGQFGIPVRRVSA